MGTGGRRKEPELRAGRLGEEEERQVNPAEAVRYRAGCSGKAKVKPVDGQRSSQGLYLGLFLAGVCARFAPVRAHRPSQGRGGQGNSPSPSQLQNRRKKARVLSSNSGWCEQQRCPVSSPPQTLADGPCCDTSRSPAGGRSARVAIASLFLCFRRLVSKAQMFLMMANL